MKLYANPTITDFRQDVNGDIEMLKIGVDKEDAYANIIGQAEGADLDKNKTATINVSTYTEPVEILPTSGKDGMKKATITLSNIPSPSVIPTFYAWEQATVLKGWTLSETPEVNDKFYIPGEESGSIQFDPTKVQTITHVEMYEGEAVIRTDVTTSDMYRYANGDISLT